jgi:hypothetical protein
MFGLNGEVLALELRPSAISLDALAEKYLQPYESSIEDTSSGRRSGLTRLADKGVSARVLMAFISN